jgi:sugar/nucleoside kinase (ribokinase family)
LWLATLIREVFSVARNIAENLARMGVNVQFMSALEYVFFGKRIAHINSEAGMCMEHSLIIDSKCTATNLAINNEEGNLEIR